MFFNRDERRRHDLLNRRLGHVRSGGHHPTDHVRVGDDAIDPFPLVTNRLPMLRSRMTPPAVRTSVSRSTVVNLSLGNHEMT